MAPKKVRLTMVVLIATAGPTMLLLDWLLQGLLLAAQPEEVRDFFVDLASQWAWYIVPCPALGGLAAFLLYPRIYQFQLARSKSEDPEKSHHEAGLMALMFCASLPQIPMLFGDFLALMGGPLRATFYTTLISTISILLIAFVAPYRCR